MEILAHKTGNFSSKKPGNGQAKELLNSKKSRNRDPGSQTLVNDEKEFSAFLLTLIIIPSGFGESSN